MLFIQEVQWCFCNIIERAWFIIRFTLSCLILLFQMSTNVSRTMAAVHISVLTHMAPITARVEMASGCVQTDTHVIVSLIIFLPVYLLFRWSHLGIYSFSSKGSYHWISWSLEVARLDVVMILWLCYFAGFSVVLLPGYLSNCRVIGKVSIRISRLWVFTWETSNDKISERLVNRKPGAQFTHSQ